MADVNRFVRGWAAYFRFGNSARCFDKITGYEVITVAVRWYLRYGLSYRDVEEHSRGGSASEVVSSASCPASMTRGVVPGLTAGELHRGRQHVRDVRTGIDLHTHAARAELDEPTVFNALRLLYDAGKIEGVEVAEFPYPVQVTRVVVG